jgi:hypothetical protein
MSLRTLHLDDRRFEELVESALARVKQTCPQWTDLSPGDPGRALLELFAYLTDVMLYRLNRLPEKVYVELLRLIGVTLTPPSAAVTTLRFSLKAPRERAVEIPRGTRVAAERSGGDGEPPVFATAETVSIAPGTTSVDVRAYHCEWIDAEHAELLPGAVGPTVRVRRPPIVAPTGDGLDLIVGVEADGAALQPGEPMRRLGDKAFRIYAEHDSFAGLSGERCIYVADRANGLLWFAPSLRPRAADGSLDEVAEPIATTPGTEREIRLWYRSGGGPRGNVPAGSLTKLRDPVPGVALDVTNPEAATGGRSGESLEHAMRRGPQELHSLERAVTASDFEALALRSSGGIGRAHAYTKFGLWRYAPRGTVEVLCIPYVPEERTAGGPLTQEMLLAHQSDEVLEQVRAALDLRRPLGTACLARWGRCKKVRVQARVSVYRQEDAQAVRRRLLERLYAMIAPLSHAAIEGAGPASAGGQALGPHAMQGHQQGWEFGQPLDAYDVYRILMSEPGVRSVEPIELCVDEVPAASITALSVDCFQPQTWYAAAGDAVYRTIDDGRGWEQIARIDGARVKLLHAFPHEAAGAQSRAGLLAAIMEFAEGRSRVYISRDCGESWQEIGSRPQFRIEDMAWSDRDGEPTLLLATEKGLYQLATRPDVDPAPILVDAQHVDLGFHAVAVSTDVWGETCVAVAAEGRRGVYLSTRGGAPGSFRHIGLRDEKIGLLCVQHRGADRFLWVGIEAAGDDPGTGCLRWQLPNSPAGWQPYGRAWQAGGCRALAFVGATALAATRRHGVLRLELDAAEPAWSAPDVAAKLPMESLQRMQVVDFVAARQPDAPSQDAPSPGAPAGAAPGAGVVMAAGPVGIYRSLDTGLRYELSSRKVFLDRVTLPPTWLFCSDEHMIAVDDDASRRD